MVSPYMNRQKRTIDKFRARIKDDVIDKNPWDIFCGIIPSKIRNRTNPEMAQLRFVKNTLSQAKSQTEVIASRCDEKVLLTKPFVGSLA